MSDPHLDRPFPRGALIGAALLLALSLALAGGARLTGVGRQAEPVSVAVESRLLRFEDRPNGAVAVHADEVGAAVAVLPSGTNGFVRSVLRGMARERRARGIGSEPAFRLTRWADGRLSLEDPTTGRIVELGAFGPTNRAAFAVLMTDPEQIP